MLVKVIGNFLKKYRGHRITGSENRGNIHQAGRDILLINQHPEPPQQAGTAYLDDLFVRKKGSEIRAGDILLFRAGHNANFNENFYLERKDIDKALAKNALYKRHSLIIGKPLSGKSRAIYELIKRHLQQYEVFIPREFSGQKDAEI